MNEKEVPKKNALVAELQGVADFPVNFVKETVTLPKPFIKSAVGFKNLHTVVLCGLMGALSVILGMFASIHLGPFSITYAWIPNRIVDLMLAGLVFGAILYKKPVSFMRIVFAQTLVKVFINAGMGTYLMAFERGQAFMTLMPVRLVKNLIMIPLDSILLFVILTSIMKVLPRLKK